MILKASEAKYIAQDLSSKGYNPTIHEFMKAIRSAARKGLFECHMPALPWLKVSPQDIEILESYGYKVIKQDGYLISWY
jgi:hypothetical protein